MPAVEFRTKVSGATSNESESVIIAQSAAYLAHADQTGTFGFAKIREALVADVVEGSVWFDWKAPVSSKENIKQVAREFDTLSRVEQHECVSNPTIA